MVSIKYNDNKGKQWNKRIPKMKSLLTRHRPEKPATLAIQGSLPTEPWPVCSAPDGCWCWCRTCRGQDLWCSSREQPAFPWVGEGPWSLSFTLYSWDIWNGNEGPQTTLVFHFMSYPVIPRLPKKVAIDTHTLQPARPTVLVMIPMELLPVVTEGSCKPEIVAVASAKVHKS